MKLSYPKPGVIQVNQFSLVLNSESKVLRDTSESTDLPQLDFNFEPLANIDSKEKNDVIDIIAICESIGHLQDVILKNNVDILKSYLKLINFR